MRGAKRSTPKSNVKVKPRGGPGRPAFNNCGAIPHLAVIVGGDRIAPDL